MVKNIVNISSFDCKSNALRHHKPTETQPTTSNATQQALKAIKGLKKIMKVGDINLIVDDMPKDYCEKLGLNVA